MSTKNGDYTVNFNLSVGGEDKTSDENLESAYEDNSGNFVQSNGVGFGNIGLTLDGGDNITVDYDMTSDSDPADKVTTHEILHSLGVSHKAMGAQGSKVNEVVVGAMLEHAGGKSEKSDINVKGIKKNHTMLKPKTGMYGDPKSHSPKVEMEESIELEGRIISN